MINEEPRRVEVDGFKVAGFSVRTKNSDEFNPEKARLPLLWEQFFSSGLTQIISHRLENEPIFGVYSHYESDEMGHYNVTAGLDSSNETNVLELNQVEVMKGSYLVFESQGAFPDCVVQTWERIWTYFQNNDFYKRAFQSDFELYSGPNQIAIYIGICSKQDPR
ncbi:Transcription activator [Legionella moravica]|uniref:Transcription activator n=1 Tax=Legionella moravica TaxID=39962 RepID=A0A378JSH6_9GAMM|nr:GyrI-like domain-containing protein [Legionella moravica]KTD37521.1 Transcription activator [Legionella moravica]STX61583.1 Transcription activator, effector binding [Legionella moravica]